MNTRLKRSTKSRSPLSEAARITALEARLAAIEQRLAAIEARVTLCGVTVPSPAPYLPSTLPPLYSPYPQSPVIISADLPAGSPVTVTAARPTWGRDVVPV